MKPRTTINIEKEIAEALKMEKDYSRETYDEILKKLLKRKKVFK